MPDGSRSIVIQGKSVFEVEEFIQDQPCFRAKHKKEYPRDGLHTNFELSASIRNIKETAVNIINKSPNIPSEAAIAVNNINSPIFLLNFIAST